MKANVLIASGALVCAVVCACDSNDPAPATTTTTATSADTSVATDTGVPEDTAVEEDTDECPEGQELKVGFTGCQWINECSDNRDDCDPNAYCFDEDPGFTCECHAGFIGDGKTCVCPVGTVYEEANQRCVDIDECENGAADCVDNAQCFDLQGGFECACKTGYEGVGDVNCRAIDCGPGYEFATSGTFINQCVDVDECFRNTDGCDDATTLCIDHNGSFECRCKQSTMVHLDDKSCGCKDGYEMQGGSCRDINECTNGAAGCDATDATCTNLDGSFVCRCKPGFEGDGKVCDPTPCQPGYHSSASGCTDTDECANGTAGCSPDANCYNTTGGFTCQCKTGYSGNGTSCSPITCPAGYELVTSGAWAGSCQDVNECYLGTDTCSANATCLNKQGSYDCQCRSGFVGDGRNCACAPGTTQNGSSCYDVNECATGAAGCSEDASCTNSYGSFSCKCKPGFEGNGKSCTPSPCQPGYTSSGGSCVDANECQLQTDDCDVDADCTNTTGSYTCKCKLGFEGTGQQCEPIQCGAGYAFKVSGTSGSCADVDECAANTDDCNANAYCANTSGSYTCSCKAGFVGDGRICECPAGTRLSGANCVDINECSENIDDCGANATCQNIFSTYSCKCNNGFEGDGRTCVASSCQPGFAGAPCADVNECTLGVDNCDPNAECVNSTGTFTCTCKTGYSGNGTSCTPSPCGTGLRFDSTTGLCIDINECLEGSANCAADANCSNTNGGFTCTCKNGYTGNGTTCTDTDECAASSDDCAQICTNRIGGYDCSCNPGFTADGHFCQSVNECLHPEEVGCFGECVNTTNGFQCFGDGGISSLAEPDESPYPNMQCAGAVGPEALWFQTGPKTEFIVDCRCPQGASEPGHFLCAAPTGPETAGVHYGTGPNAADQTNGYIEGCSTDYDKDKVYFGVTWGDSRDSTRGFVIAVDPTTGNRTVVSGQYADPALGLVSVGTGNRFDNIRDLALGPDGFLYVFEDSVPGGSAQIDDTNPNLQGRSIYKVDLTNGNRTLHWNYDSENHPEFGTCSNGKPPGSPGRSFIDIQTKQFELDEAGNFILATNRNMSPSPGYGFVRVAADGRSCQWITRDGTEPNNLLFNAPGAGSGVIVTNGFDQGFGYRDGVIYATNFLTSRLFKVDVATGQRSILWSGANPVLGTGPGPGVWHFFYYPLFDLWVSGGNIPNTPSNASLFDPASGDTWGWMYQRPTADSTGTVGGGSGGNDVYAGPLGIETNQLRGPILGVLSETLHHRPWCISPTEPDRLLVATDRVGIVKVEVETGNTMNFSQ